MEYLEALRNLLDKAIREKDAHREKVLRELIKKEEQLVSK